MVKRKHENYVQFVFSEDVVVLIPRTRDWKTYEVPEIPDKRSEKLRTKKRNQAERLAIARQLFDEKLARVRHVKLDCLKR